jgi:hypothetical protein
VRAGEQAADELDDVHRALGRKISLAENALKPHVTFSDHVCGPWLGNSITITPWINHEDETVSLNARGVSSTRALRLVEEFARKAEEHRDIPEVADVFDDGIMQIALTLAAHMRAIKEKEAERKGEEKASRETFEACAELDKLAGQQDAIKNEFDVELIKPEEGWNVIRRDDIPGMVYSKLEDYAEGLLGRYADRDKINGSFSGMFSLWKDEKLREVAGSLTRKVGTTPVTELQITTLPVDSEWIAEYFTPEQLEEGVDQESIRHLMVTARLKPISSSPVYSRVDYVLYVHNGKSGPKIVATTRKSGKVATGEQVTQSIRDESAANRAAIDAWNARHPSRVACSVLAGVVASKVFARIG